MTADQERTSRAVRRVTAWLLAVTAVVTSCASPRMKMLTDKRYAPRPASFPVVLYQGSVETPHEEIAILDSRGVEELTTATRKLLVEDLQARAAQVGADAVTNVTLLIRPQRGWIVDPQTPFRSWRQGWTDIHFLRGQAIRFKPLMIETGDSGSTAERFDYAEGERPAIRKDSKPELEIYPVTDRSGRKGWASRRAKPTKPKLPTVEKGN